MSIKLTDFDIYQDLLETQSGIILEQDQTYLLEARLTPVAKKWGYPSLNAMTMAIQGVPDPELIRDVVQAMVDQDTMFFRDIKPFEDFKNHILPYFNETRAKQKKLRILSAGSSTGQEPYSISIYFSELQDRFPGWDLEILALDISQDFVETSKEGRYTQFEMQRGMPVELLLKYFDQIKDKWQIHKEERKRVKFKHHNLLNPLPDIGPFDVIFCRNVISYFNPKTQSAVLNALLEHLTQDGLLVLGRQETPKDTEQSLQPIAANAHIYAFDGHPLHKS